MQFPCWQPHIRCHVPLVGRRSVLGGLAGVLGAGVLGPPAWAAAPLVLTVGVPIALPGYEVQDEATFHIHDPLKKRLTECVAAKLNARITWVSYPTRRVMQMLQDQQLDMIFPMGFTAERAVAMHQSVAIWQNPDVYVSLHPVDMHDKSLRLVARLGSPQHAEYMADGYANMSGAYSYEELARLLARGQVDVVVVPRSIYEELKNLWPPGTQMVVGRPRDTGFYLHKDDPKGLLKPLNDSITRCRQVAGLK